MVVSRRLSFLLLFLPITLLFFLLVGRLVPNVFAQTACSNDRNTGLVSGTSLNGLFGNPTGNCVIDPKAAYANFKVPTFDDLKSLFFTQNKTTPKFTISASSATIACPGGIASGQAHLQNMQNLANFNNNNALVDVQCNETHIDDIGTFKPFSNSSNTIILFVENNLFIDSSLDYDGDNYGLVIIVKGDVFIDPDAQRLHAVLIAQGNIYTSSTGAANTGVVPNSKQLNVYGSLISLGQSGQKIYFNRSLTNNSIPSEAVYYQPKYLVILKGLMTQSYQVEREIGPDEIPGSLPSPTIQSSPDASGNTGSTFKNPLCVYNVFRIFTELDLSAGSAPYPSPTCP